MRVVGAREVLQAGLAGTEQLVEKITTIIRDQAKRADVRELARRIVRLAPPQDATAEIQATWDYLTGLNAPPYRADPVDVQLLTTPGAWEGLSGVDCKKYTIVAGSILEALGHPVKVRVVDQRAQLGAEAGYHHVYLQVFNKDRGTWVPFDPVTKSFRRPAANVGTEPAHRARRTYMLRPAYNGSRRPQPIGFDLYNDLIKPFDPTRPENTGVRAAWSLIPGGSAIVAAADATAAVQKEAWARQAAAEKAAKDAAAAQAAAAAKSQPSEKPRIATGRSSLIKKKGTTTTTAAPPPPPPAPAPGMSTTTKVVAGVAGAAVVAGLLYALTRKPKARRANPRRKKSQGKRRAA
ncbi:MAG: transglutaminase-like domain-containing protein [Elusimicrobiota bacterium]|jgi:hypothetical protein